MTRYDVFHCSDGERGQWLGCLRAINIEAAQRGALLSFGSHMAGVLHFQSQTEKPIA